MNSRGRQATPQELEELRASLDERLGALEAALADPKQHSSLEKLIVELARVATEEADATAREAVDAVRTEGLSALAAERAAAASLRQAAEEIEVALQAERAAISALRQQLVELREQLADAQQQVTASNQAREQEQAELSALKRELETALGAVKSERAAATAAQQELASGKQARERDQTERATFKRELENALVLLKTERARVSSLEQALKQAKADAAETERKAAAQLRDTVSALEHAAQTARAELVTARQEIDGMRSDAEARFSNLSGSQSELAQELSKAQQALREAQARADEARARADEARALAEQAQARIAREQARAEEAILERDSLKQQLGAVTRDERTAPPAESHKYEELLQSSEQRIRSLELALRDAETRAEAAECELVLLRRAPTPQSASVSPSKTDAEAATTNAADFPGPPRAAKRVAISGELGIEVDGTTAILVDVSVTGAQILASASMKPNRLVRLTLPDGAKTIVCKGKVMWARLEPRSGELWYRAGVLFTTADQTALEAFVNHHLSSR